VKNQVKIMNWLKKKFNTPQLCSGIIHLVGRRPKKYFTRDTLWLSGTTVHDRVVSTYQVEYWSVYAERADAGGHERRVRTVLLRSAAKSGNGGRSSCRFLSLILRSWFLRRRKARRCGWYSDGLQAYRPTGLQAYRPTGLQAYRPTGPCPTGTSWTP